MPNKNSEKFKMKTKKFSSIALLMLVKAARPLSYWFNIGTGTPPIYTMTITGPNEEYCIQGEGTYASYTINWNTGAAVSKGEQTFSQSNMIGHRTQGDNTYNIVLAGKAVYRFNINPITSSNLQEYPVASGPFHGFPFWASGTNFMFVSTITSSGSACKLYRLHSDRIIDVKTFSVGENSRAYGVLYGTGWLVVSLGRPIRGSCMITPTVMMEAPTPRYRPIQRRMLTRSGGSSHQKTGEGITLWVPRAPRLCTQSRAPMEQKSSIIT